MSVKPHGGTKCNKPIFNWYLIDLPILLSKMYQLVSVKYQLKITKVEIWVNQYLTNTLWDWF